MKKSYETFRRNFENAKRIWNLEEDWITPVEYLPYIDDQGHQAMKVIIE